jgi:predicted amidohydrolase YtcJ
MPLPRWCTETARNRLWIGTRLGPEHGSPPEFPTHASLDKVVLIIRRAASRRRSCARANAAAMRLAGISRDTKDPPGGRRCATRTASPRNLVDRPHRVQDCSTRRRFANARSSRPPTAVAAGLTAVHEMGIDDATVAVYRSFAAAGRPKVRVWRFVRRRADRHAALAQAGYRRTARRSRPARRQAVRRRCARLARRGAAGSLLG